MCDMDKISPLEIDLNDYQTVLLKIKIIKC
jgi:hypothetical protein